MSASTCAKSGNSASTAGTGSPDWASAGRQAAAGDQPPRFQHLRARDGPHRCYSLIFATAIALARREAMKFSKLSNCAEITWSVRPWENPVVPLAVKLRLLHVQPCHLLVWYFDACWIDLRIKAGLDT